MIALITGISGQDGWYLARQLMAEGYRVVGLSRDAAAAAGDPAPVDAWWLRHRRTAAPLVVRRLLPAEPGFDREPVSGHVRRATTAKRPAKVRAGVSAQAGQAVRQSHPTGWWVASGVAWVSSNGR